MGSRGFIWNGILKRNHMNTREINEKQLSYDECGILSMYSQSVLVLPLREQCGQRRINLGELVVMLSESVIADEEGVHIGVKASSKHEGIVC